MSQRPFSLALVTAVASVSLAAACGGSGGETKGDTSTSTNTGGKGGTGGTGSTTGHGAGGGFISSSSGQMAMLSITPQAPTLDVTGAPATLQLQAVLSDGSDPGKVTWDIGDVVVGTVSQTGLFQSQGFVAGVATVTANALGLTATANITVRVHIEDNAGNLSPADMATLKAGGAADPSFRFLYPYDGTVFPRALRAPEIQMSGAADATYVKVAFGDYSYEGFFGASSPTRAAIPQAIWKGLTESAKGTDAVKVDVTKLSLGAAAGPVTESWKVAEGSFKGIIYYNTYKSNLTNNGAVMRVRPNQDAEVFIGNCTVCHSVSANGNVLAGGLSWTNGNPLDSGSFDIAADGTQTARYVDDDGRKFAFGALSPNGEVLLSNAVPSTGSPIRGLGGAYPTKLYDTKTGAEIVTPSLTSALTNALTPAFSPDGKKVAFNFWDQGNGKTLGVMDVDLGQSPPAFSNLLMVATATRAIAAWPSLLPDGKAVVFHDGDAFDTAGYGGQTAYYSELRLVDIATQTVSPLNALNGRRPDNTIYLPYGDAEEANLDYEPTVLPIPVGGYYWVVFTSRRAYGNTIAVNGTVPGGDNKWGSLDNGNEVPSVRKKLWVAAIDVDYAGKPDPSHPAFYLGEQELEAGNMRAFVSLEPCKQDGSGCESAAECCNGFCRLTDTLDPNGNPISACVPPPGGCSNIDEVCSAASDCCIPNALCINHRCALAPPG